MNDDTTKTLTAANILSMAVEMQDKNAGLWKIADSIYESDLLKELRKDRDRLDWIQANWSRCGFISVGEFPIGKMREEIDAEMRGDRDAEDWK